MRNLLCSLLAGAVLAAPSWAQTKAPPVVIKDVRPGFHPYAPDDDALPYRRCKIGMWTPVYMDVECGPNDLRGLVEIECPDDQGVGTVFSTPFNLAKNEKQTIISYLRLGTAGAEFEVRLKVKDDVLARKSVSAQPLHIGGQLVVTLGSRLPDLQEGLIALSPHQKPEPGQSKSWPRFAGYETKVANLPDNWLGYDAVDLLFLGTHNANFIKELLQDSGRLKAITQWVRQGGRLIVSVDPDQQALVAELLGNAAWQPAVPVVPPRVQENIAGNAVKRLIEVENRFKIQNLPFPAIGAEPVKVALLQPPQAPVGAWEVLAKANDGRPLIVRMPYGLGQITLIAFDLDEGAFRVWDGRALFLKGLVKQLEPTFAASAEQHQGNWQGGQQTFDVTTVLQRDLDTFDVPVISFGWVALFIFIYILIVGPLDYFILKKVFKRLEWTWITFPTVVVIVSVAAYFTAYAIKGNELKINKIDVVDFDMRTDPNQTCASGTTWFSIMSPRIEHYTVGIEATPASLMSPQIDQKPTSADVVSWLGRPENYGPGAMGIDRSQSWTRREYHYAEDARGLIGVPIPVWTTKAFTARWQALLAQAPMEIELRSHQRGEMRVSGTLKNNLAVQLDDAWLFYRDRCYPLANIPAGARDINIALENRNAEDPQNWANRNEAAVSPGNYDPSAIIKALLFLENTDGGSKQRDYFQRRLDQGWRLGPRGEALSEAILFGRVRRLSGDAQTVNGGNPLPSRLWLRDLPAAGKTRPTLHGSMNQDTYIRIIVPVQPEG